MISVNTYILGFGPGGLTRDVRVTVQSDADGVGSVQVRDHSGVPIGEPINAGCIRSFMFDVRGIPSGQFPIFVWADECSNGEPSNQPRPYGPHDTGTAGGGGTGGGGRPACPPPQVGAAPSPQCVDAINEARRLRNQVIAACDRVRRLRRELTELTALAVALYAVAALLTTAAVICFVQAGLLAATPFTAWAAPIATGIGIGLLVAAAAALAGAIAATVLAANKRRELASAEIGLETLGEQFRAAAMDVTQTCCPGDFLDVDVTLPSCR